MPIIMDTWDEAIAKGGLRRLLARLQSPRRGATRLALITPAQVAFVLKEAEIAEDEARAFNQDRAHQRRPYGLHACTVIPFRRTGSDRHGR
jgi:hypothetical protein